MSEALSTAEEKDAVARSARIYRFLLRLYPQAHRKEWGDWMCQLFRDQCRDAYREGRGIWRRVLPDMLFTALREHVFEIKRRKNMNCFNARKCALILLAAGLGAGMASFHFIGGPWLARLAALSAAGIGAKAGVELFCPSGEWKRVILSTGAVMFFYALFMPAWAKLGLVHGQWLPLNYFTMICLMANPLVAVVKSGQFLMERRKR